MLNIKTVLILLTVVAPVACGIVVVRAIPTKPGEDLDNADSTVKRWVLASVAGAALNSDINVGGGTDDTAVLQSVLDRAADGLPIHLLIDGAALVSGLNVYGKTSVECTAGGGLYLKDGSSRAIIRNVHRSRGAITDEHITVRGCFLNGNRDRQPGRVVNGQTTNQEADGAFIAGLQFFGVSDLILEDLMFWHIRAFGAWVANANRIYIENQACPNVDDSSMRNHLR